MDEKIKAKHIMETLKKHKPEITKVVNLFTCVVGMAMIEHSQAIANATVHDAEIASIVPSQPYVCKKKTYKKKSTDKDGFIVETTTKQIYEAYNEYKECEI